LQIRVPVRDAGESLREIIHEYADPPCQMPCLRIHRIGVVTRPDIVGQNRRQRTGFNGVEGDEGRQYADALAGARRLAQEIAVVGAHADAYTDGPFTAVRAAKAP